MKPEWDAVVTALKAAWPQGRVYYVGEVPANPVTPYQVVSIAPGDPRNYKVGSRHTAKLFRTAVQNFGRNVAEVTFAAARAETALLDERPAAGYSPARRETATLPVRDPDDGGLLMVVHTYTFTKH
jgi:hypothetical protein